jgi:hypothetical protein
MNDDIREQLVNMFKQSQEGFFGAEAQRYTEYFANLQGDDVFYALIQNFYAPVDGDNEQIFNIADLIAQLLMVVYRETKNKDQAFAEAYLKSFIDDFPGTFGTALAPKWQSLASTSITFRAIASNNSEPLLAWQSAKPLFEAYNEFLNVLLSYLIIGWQIVRSKRYSLNTFKNAYGNKAQVFSDLTDGENGPFYIFHRIAKPRIRNAIAHGDIHLNRDKAIILYADGKGNKRRNYTIDVVEFVGLAAVGSHLARAYLTAIACIAAYEHDEGKAKRQLPEHVYKLLDSLPRV